MATSLKQDLIRLRKYKRDSAAATKTAKDLTANFKAYQKHCLERMERDDVESLKSAGTLFSPVRDKVYAKIEDRSEFVAWALDNSDALQDVFNRVDCVEGGARAISHYEDFLRELAHAIAETPFIQLREHADPLNALVRERLDDNEILPPGVSFRTDDYISQRAS